VGRYEEIRHTYLPMQMEETECSEMFAYKIQTPGNYPEESIQHSEQGESLKSRFIIFLQRISFLNMYSEPQFPGTHYSYFPMNVSCYAGVWRF